MLPSEPILLSCAHSYCRRCVVQCQQPVCHSVPTTSPSNSHSSTVSGTVPFTHLQSITPLSIPSISGLQSFTRASDTISVCISDQDVESDKLSVISETDSGVVVSGRSSRPPSLIGSTAAHSSPAGFFAGHRIPSILTPSTSGWIVTCKACHKPTVFPDEQTVMLMPVNNALVNVIKRYNSGNSSARDKNGNSESYNCQLCDTEQPAVANVFCEQCDIYYCQSCQNSLHPARGPLATHKLVPPSARKSYRTTIGLAKNSKCPSHSCENLSMYCMICRLAVCCQCLQEPKHSNHDVQSLDKICKTQKVRLILIFGIFLKFFRVVLPLLL
uniref:B box-type domain-containing protein n=1 Tax=Setaria digitata TaxID=48799 RepID=A0A915PLC5_9BILA